MKRGGILHPGLNHLLASTGHTDYITICDRGFPVPVGPERIDLALVDGIPTVLQVLRAIDAEWSIDRIVITQEMRDISPALVDELQAAVPGIPLETISHLELKRLGATGRATIRTGDTTPYANIIIVSG